MVETLENMTLRHVIEGRRVVVRQRELIARHRARGLDTADMEVLLDTFEHSLAIFEDHLRAIQKGAPGNSLAH